MPSCPLPTAAGALPATRFLFRSPSLETEDDPEPREQQDGKDTHSSEGQRVRMENRSDAWEVTAAQTRATCPGASLASAHFILRVLTWCRCDPQCTGGKQRQRPRDQEGQLVLAGHQVPDLRPSGSFHDEGRRGRKSARERSREATRGEAAGGKGMRGWGDAVGGWGTCSAPARCCLCS